jgi:prepilin-type N-terminal cleavage/methylation domain-containing protein
MKLSLAYPGCSEEKKGFTLLEILIAIFILAIIMTIVLGPFTGIMASSREAERKVDLYQTARSLMDLISADIRGVFPQPAGDEGHFFRVTEEESEGITTMPRLDFITTHSLSIGPPRARFLSEVTYLLRKNPKNELYTLIRRSESPPSEPFDEGGKEVPLCRTIESFRIQSVSEDEATKGITGEIPRALVIDFTLNLEGEKENFVTMVRPMVAAGALREGLPGSGSGSRGVGNVETPKAQIKTPR